MKNSAIVGMGRTGTTALREILLYLYKINKAKGISSGFRKGPLRYSDWDKSCIDFKESVVIIYKRDLRDVLASTFRSISTKGLRMYNDDKFLLKNIKNYPPNFRIYKKIYGIPENEIIEYGKKLIDEGWDQWISGVDYIFCYESFIRDPYKIINEVSDLINFPKRNSAGAFEASQAWKIKHPKHITNSGATQSWHDIFSEAQEKVIIDNFGHWLKKQGYING